MKNEPQIGRRQIREILCFLFNFVKKFAPNRPKADKRGFYVLYIILLKREPQIGRKMSSEFSENFSNFLKFEIKNIVLFRKNGPIWKEIFKHSDMIFKNINSFKTYNLIHTDIEIRYFGISLLKKSFLLQNCQEGLFFLQIVLKTLS